MPHTRTHAASPVPLAAEYLTPPAIGAEWPAQGGIYAGLARGVDGAPDHHLILSTQAPERCLNWTAAMDWAKRLVDAGHADWSLPTRAESALLYANLREQFDDAWHWTSETYGSYAWDTYFNNGGLQNYYDDKSFEARARAVRRFTAQFFDPSTERLDATAAAAARLRTAAPLTPTERAAALEALNKLQAARQLLELADGALQQVTRETRSEPSQRHSEAA